MEGTSTHTDLLGNILAVYDDGDLGVYKHENNANGKSPTEENIDKRHEKSTSAGGKKIGETKFWDEFLTVGKNRHPEGKIHFNETWDSAIDLIHSSADNQDLSTTAQDSRLNKRFDLKNLQFLAEDGVMTGKLLDGFYASARSAGNYTAGLNGRTGTFQGFHIGLNTYMKLAGALNQKQFTSKNAGMIVIFGKSFGPRPYYGEDEYSGRMILEGWNSKRK